MAAAYVSSTIDRSGTKLYIKCTETEPVSYRPFRPIMAASLGLTYCGMVLPLLLRNGVRVALRPIGVLIRDVTGGVMTFENAYAIDYGSKIVRTDTCTVSFTERLGGDGTTFSSPASQSTTAVTNGSWVDSDGFAGTGILQWNYAAVSGVTPADPTAIVAVNTNLRLWIDCGEIAGLSDGQDVATQMVDKSPQAYTIAAPTSGQRPAYRSGASAAAVNGRSVATFDHTANDRMRITGGIGINGAADPFFICVTFRAKNQVSGTREVYYHNNGSGTQENRPIQMIFQSAVGGAMTATPGDDWGTGASNPTSWVNGTYLAGEVMTVAFGTDGAATSDIDLWLNMMKTTTTAQSRRDAAADGFIEIGRASMDLCEICVIKEDLTDTQKRQIMAGQMQRWGVVGRRTYLDSAAGNDANQGTLASPIQTLAAGALRCRNFMPDELFDKKGTTRTIASEVDLTPALGSSFSEVARPYGGGVDTYGTGDRPIWYGTNNVTTATTGRRGMHRRIRGIRFYHAIRDPDSGTFLGNNVVTSGDSLNLGGTDVAAGVGFVGTIVEDNVFDFPRECLTVTNGACDERGLFINRNFFGENFHPQTWIAGVETASNRGMGCYIHANTGISQFNDNIFFHCGWSEHTNLSGAGRVNPLFEAGAIIQNHGIYNESTATGNPIEVSGNAFLDCAAQGATCYSGGRLFENLFERNGIGHGMRGGTVQTHGCMSYRNWLGQGRDIHTTGTNLGISESGSLLSAAIECMFRAPASVTVGAGQGIDLNHDGGNFTLQRRTLVEACIFDNRVGSPILTSDEVAFDPIAEFRDNLIWQPPGAVGTRLAVVGLAASSDLLWAGNRYRTSAANPFAVNGSNRTSAQFRGDFSDVTSADLAAEPARVAAGRTVNDFAVSLGLANKAALIAEWRTRAPGTWNAARSPLACLNYIRAGYALAVPTGLAVAAGSGNDLIWTAHPAVAANEANGTAAYRVYRGTVSDGTAAVLLSEVNTAAFNDPTGDATHYYAVTVMSRDRVESGYSTWTAQSAPAGVGSTAAIGRSIFRTRRRSHRYPLALSGV